MKNQIAKNLATNYIGNFLGMALGFFVTPFLINKLGKEAFGITILAESIISFFQIFAFSVRIALSRYTTIALSKNQKKDFIEYLSTGRRILYIVMLLGLVPGIIVSLSFPSLFNVPVQFHQQSRVLFLLITIAFSLTIPNIVFWSVLYARQRYDLLNVSNFGGVILRVVFIFILFSFLPSSYVNIVTYGFVYLSMTWIQNYLVYRWSIHLMPDLEIKSRNSNPAKVKEILSFSSYASLGNLGAVAHESVMNIIVNVFLGPIYNTIYSVSIRIPNMMKRLFLEPSWSLTPTFTDLAAKKDQGRLEMLFTMYLKLINLIIFPLSLIIIFLSHPIISLWVGKDFAEASQLMPYFMIVSLMMISASVCSCILTAYGEVKYPTIINLVIAFLSVVFGCLLAFHFKQGLVGIGVAAVAFNFLGSVVLLPAYACKVSGIKVNKYWIESLLKPLLITVVVFMFLMFCFKKNWGTLGLGVSDLVLYFLFNLMVYVAGYFLVMRIEERKQLLDLISIKFLKKKAI